MTAYDALATAGQLREGDVVLLLGVTSGVGLFTAALGHQIGAHLVIGTSRSAAKLARVVQVGRLAGDRAVLDLDRLAYRRVSLVGARTTPARTSPEAARSARSSWPCDLGYDARRSSEPPG